MNGLSEVFSAHLEPSKVSKLKSIPSIKLDDFHSQSYGIWKEVVRSTGACGVDVSLGFHHKRSHRMEP